MMQWLITYLFQCEEH